MSATVLLAEDDAPSRQIYYTVLDAEGYRVIEVPDGKSALDVLNSEPVDLLLTDVMMPGMTGDELARLLRQEQPELKVLYLTGYSDRLFREKTTLWADEAFLEKPCSVKALREAVSLLLIGRLEAA